MTSKKELLAIGSIFCAVLVLLVLLSSCAPQENKKPENTQQSEPVITVDWSPTSDCSTCHAAESNTIKESGTLANTHYLQSSTCISCHNDETSLKRAHQGAPADKDATTTSKKIKISDSSCSNALCHSLTQEEMSALTINSDVLKDDKGNQVNPHDVATLSPSHIEANMSCADCHTVHKQKEVIDYCISCHHEGVFECGTCHA